MSKKRRKQLWQGGRSRRAEQLLKKLPRLERNERATAARLEKAQESWDRVPGYDMEGERLARGRVGRLKNNLAQIQERKRKVELWLKRNPRKVATIPYVESKTYLELATRRDSERCQWWFPTDKRCWRKVAVKGGQFCEEHEDAYAR